MKKLLSMGLLTVCALAGTQQQAQAWVNAKFSVGLNWQLQSGNNNVLWGAWKNGQVPGPEAFGQPGGGGPGPGYYGPGPGAGPGMMPPAAQSFPYFGSNPAAYPSAPQAAQQIYPQGFPQGFPQAFPQGFPVETAPPPLATQQPQKLQAYNSAPNYYNPYQTVSYQQPASYYAPQYYAAYPPNYGYGYGYGAGYAQAPSYWYNNR